MSQARTGPDDQRTREVLEEIVGDRELTQRTLSQRIGMSLGMANLYLKRLARKGLIKITTVPGRRLLRYMLTPKGLAEKARLTYEFAEYSLRFLQTGREYMRKRFRRLAEAGRMHVVFCHDPQLAERGELAYLALVECGLQLAGVVSRTESPDTFLGREVRGLDALKRMRFDAVVAFCEADRQAVRKWVAKKQELVLLQLET